MDTHLVETFSSVTKKLIERVMVQNI